MVKLNPHLNVFGKDVPCWERGQQSGRTRLLDPDKLFNNLCKIHQTFDTFGIRHWLSHGTMLGVYREGNFILWDDDCDIGMDFSQRQSMNYACAIQYLEKCGFYIPPSNPNYPITNENAPFYDFVAIRDGEKVEGWFFEKKGDYYIYDQSRCGNVLKHPAKYYDELGVINFRGIEFATPSHVEDYLVMMYGKSWKIPNKNRKYNHQS